MIGGLLEGDRLQWPTRAYRSFVRSNATAECSAVELDPCGGKGSTRSLYESSIVLTIWPTVTALFSALDQHEMPIE